VLKLFLVLSNYLATFRYIAFQAEFDATSDHDTQLFLASKIKVKGVEAWFQKITRVIKTQVHPDNTGPNGANTIGIITTPEISETTSTDVNLIKPHAISPEQFDNLQGELEALTPFLQNDLVANYRITIGQTVHQKSKKWHKHKVPLTKQVGLTAFNNIIEGKFPSELNERQAGALMGIEHPVLNARGKVDTC
jgi:hypothetical protein